jgi:predicted TIM-barrel fold metal-dependent hydrolase
VGGNPPVARKRGVAQNMGQHRPGSSASRRQILGALTAFGAGALAAAPRLFAQSAAPRRPAMIDTHHHYFPPEIQTSWRDYAARKGESPMVPGQARWTPSASLEEMDKNGIATSILSISSIPGVWFDLDTQGMRRMARLSNEFAARMVADHPGRYGLFASLPMPDVDGSLKEIEHAFDSLKADGIVLATSFGDRWPGDRAFRPVFEELNRRKAVVFFHPVTPNCCVGLHTGIPPSMLEVPYDTGRAITSLLLSGSFVRLRDIRWLFSHGGGVMPMLAGRVAAFAQRRRDSKEFAPDGVLAELQRLHYDTANAAWPVSLAALLKMVPPSQVLFGTDFPYFLTAPQMSDLDETGLSPGALAAIQRGNAARLIARLKA